MHPDAYKLMHYAVVRGDQNLYIWNVRDGAAPDSILVGKQRFDHMNPEADVFLPAHVPNLGDWVFTPAALSGEPPDGVPPDAPRLRRVDAVLWDYFGARAEGYELGYRHAETLWKAKAGTMSSGDSSR